MLIGFPAVCFKQIIGLYETVENNNKYYEKKYIWDYFMWTIYLFIFKVACFKLRKWKYKLVENLWNIMGERGVKPSWKMTSPHTLVELHPTTQSGITI